MQYITQSPNTQYNQQLRQLLQSQYNINALINAQTSADTIETLIIQLQHDIKQHRLNLPLFHRPQYKLVPVHSNQSIDVLLCNIQQYINLFEYNHIGKEFVVVDKSYNYTQLCRLTQFIISQSYPIKCLESVCIIQYLTRDYHDKLLRIPLRFKSICNSVEYWHIVLLVYNKQTRLYGTLGLSRRNTLSYYSCQYTTCSKLIQQYTESYRQIGHTVHSITIGVSFPYKTKSIEPIYWKLLNIPNLWNVPNDRLYTVIDEYMRCIESMELMIRSRYTCKLHTVLQQYCKVVKINNQFQIVLQ